MNDESAVVRMANQIGDFFAAYPEDEAVAGIAGHIRSFWEPRMRRQAYALVDAMPERFDELVRRALARLREGDPVCRPADPEAVSPPA